ncbi:MAG TPA: hypothetical protein VF173_20660 [Thermoanaerobaculia bacterium]|nr:hypothetical protein [Thermoanaerobaculia bacterium]
MPKMCPKVILEGTRLTLKTEIAFGKAADRVADWLEATGGLYLQ